MFKVDDLVVDLYYKRLEEVKPSDARDFMPVKEYVLNQVKNWDIVSGLSIVNFSCHDYKTPLSVLKLYIEEIEKKCPEVLDKICLEEPWEVAELVFVVKQN